MSCPLRLSRGAKVMLLQRRIVKYVRLGVFGSAIGGAMRSRLLSALVVGLGVALLLGGCDKARPALPAAVTSLHVQATATGSAGALVDAVARIADGGTITLAAGTYNLDQLLRIDKSVQLIGAGMSKTIIVSTVKNKGVLFTGAHHFSASGITFSHEGAKPGDAVWVDAGTVQFNSCRFTGAASNNPKVTDEALWLRGTTTGVVENCTADQSDAGIGISGTATPIIQGCVCTSDSSTGLSVYGKGHPTLRFDRCSDNGQFGVTAQDRTRVVIQSCQCSAENDGIVVVGQATGSVSYCTCKGNSTAGISIRGRTRFAVDRNTCNSSADGDGIDVVGTAKVAVTNNVCQNDKGVGIGFWGAARGTASDNACNLDGRGDSGGLCVGGHAVITLNGNTCNDNANYGILFRDSGRGTARNNLCSGNNYGIIINSSASATLVGNSLDSNKTQAVGRW